MTLRKIMLVTWAIFSLGWLVSSYFVFNLDQVGYAYNTYDRFAARVARGRSDDPMQWDYNNRGYKQAQAAVDQINKNIGLFALLGIGLPLIVLAAGSAALPKSGKAGSKNRKAQKT